jgi:acyl-CoA ligase (AMP-forming) (exosortase A-associated)
MTSTFPKLARIEDPLLTLGRAWEGHVALTEGERDVRYGELIRRVRAFAAVLEARGVTPGDRVAIHLDKSIDFVIALYATFTVGAIAVPIGEVLRSPQVAHIVRDSGSRLLVTDKRKAARLAPDEFAGVPFVEVRAGRAEEPRHVGALPGGETPAAILYTSGSTGRPKGILLSHQNLLAGARIVSSYLEIAPDERILSVLPFSFDYGLNQLLCSVQNGASLVLCRSHLPADICRTMEAKRITALAGVPPLFIQLMDRHSPLSRMLLPELRYLTNSGGVFPVELVRRYREHLPHVRLYLMYGLSEAFRSTYLPPSEVDRIPSSMGRAIPETELLVLDEQGRECAPDVVGELVHRGPTVALGYWNDPAATARVFRTDPARPGASERVVYSGDLVKRDADGYLYFCGRRDQLIKCFGYRVSPDEVEELLLASGLVREAAVRGEPDPVAGARVEAHIVPEDPASFDVEALLAHCRSTMPRYMVPRTVHVHGSLPRTASGKLDRKALSRDEAPS